MKLAVCITLALAITCTPFMAGGDVPTANKYVTCRVSINKKSLKPGSTGKLLITLAPARGIHINLNPPIALLLDSSDSVTRKGSPEIPRKEKFLDVAKAIKQAFVLSPASRPGIVTIRGTIIYYYCSDAEGWCSKFKQAIEMPIRVGE